MGVVGCDDLPPLTQDDWDVSVARIWEEFVCMDNANFEAFENAVLEFDGE